LAHLAALTRLRSLRLDRTLITDGGLGYLRRLRSLRNLEIWNTRVTEARIAALRNDMPEVAIDYQPADND
jgi:hypothetical protein